jgi:hypothetical protein
MNIAPGKKNNNNVFRDTILIVILSFENMVPKSSGTIFLVVAAAGNFIG